MITTVILVFGRGVSAQDIEAASQRLQALGLAHQQVRTQSSMQIVVLDDVSTVASHVFTQLPGVSKAIRVDSQLSLTLKKASACINLANGTVIGGEEPLIIAGPCSVESEAHIVHLAHQVKESGAAILRGGAFKPRTSPYDFQGLGIEGMKFLAVARAATGLPVVSEVMAPNQVAESEPYVDIFQIGARNMYNYDLLKEVGRANKPVLLKRAMSATVGEWLSSAEYIMLEGNLQVVLCERGIRTFETHTRNTLDLASVAAVKQMCQLPVIVDPSHGTGRPELIKPMSLAAIAAGADGVMIEVHNQPAEAMSDREQAITPAALREITLEMRILAATLRGKNTFPHKPVVAGSPLTSAVPKG